MSTRIDIYNRSSITVHVVCYKNDDKEKALWMKNGDPKEVGPGEHVVRDDLEGDYVQLVVNTHDGEPPPGDQIIPTRGYLVTDLPTSGRQAWVYIGGSPGNWDFRTGAGHKHRVKMQPVAFLMPQWIANAPEGAMFKGIGPGGGDSWPRQLGQPPWAVDPKGRQIDGSLTQVSGGSASLVWGVNANEEIYRWQYDGLWTKMPGAAVNVSVASDGTVWCVNRNGSIYRWDGGDWTQINGSLRQVSVGSASRVWGVNGNDEIYRWQGGDSWTKVPGEAANVSVASDGTVWCVTRYERIYQLWY
jgi:hypothetical protein